MKELQLKVLNDQKALTTSQYNLRIAQIDAQIAKVSAIEETPAE